MTPPPATGLGTILHHGSFFGLSPPALHNSWPVFASCPVMQSPPRIKISFPFGPSNGIGVAYDSLDSCRASDSRRCFQMSLPVFGFIHNRYDSRVLLPSCACVYP